MLGTTKYPPQLSGLGISVLLSAYLCTGMVSGNGVAGRQAGRLAAAQAIYEHQSHQNACSSLTFALARWLVGTFSCIHRATAFCHALMVEKLGCLQYLL